MKNDSLFKKIFKKGSSLYIIRNLYNYLSKRRKRQLYILLFLNVISGFAESFTLGTLFPFLGILLNPNKINDLIPEPFVGFLPIDDPKYTLILLTILFISSSIISSVLRLLNLWINGRVSAAIGSDFGYQCFRKILNASYPNQLLMDTNKNLSTLSVHLHFTVICINAFLKIITFAVISIAIILFLLYFDFNSALIATIVLSVSYLSLIKLTKTKLLNNSEKISDFTKNEVSLFRESFAFVKEIILESSQKFYIRNFRKIDSPMRRMQAQNTFLALSPRYIMESVGIVLIAFFALFSSLKSNEAFLIIPTLGTIALGAQKLLPAIQQVYRSWALLKGYNSDMNNVLKLLDMPSMNQQLLLDDSLNIKENIFNKSLEFKNISFSYSKTSPLVLKNLNFKIYKGERIGIIGSTGSGKSTLLDLILTLLSPSEGEILIDGIEISKKEQIINWRSSIAHVPQSLFLIDDTIAANIALTHISDKKNYGKILNAAKKAQILSFCESLNEKFETQVGENGVKLSGGQRQRIGIARALYKNAKIIIFDEATSALDLKTEKIVMDSISQISREITIIMVTHRLSSLECCDRVIKIKNGKLDKIGPPNEFLSDY